ncbi:MAG: peroxiredoxin, partial [Novosphingobium sp.]
MMNKPGIGDAFPDIAMETPDGGSVKASDFAGQKLVVFFYPKDNTPGCTTENIDFSVLKGEFDAAGVALLGVSKDSAKKHQNFIAK